MGEFTAVYPTMLAEGESASAFSSVNVSNGFFTVIGSAAAQLRQKAREVNNKDKCMVISCLGESYRRSYVEC